MARSRTTLVAIAAGVATLGAGIGVAGLASADPTPTPTAPTSGSPSAAAPSTASPSPEHPGNGRHGPRRHRGEHRQELVSQLATKLGVSQDKVRSALHKFHDQRRATPPTTGSRPDHAARDAALAKFLAAQLGVDRAEVDTALAQIRSTFRADRAGALKTRLDAAVKAGTLTQAEADAVQKAFDRGVINLGPR